MKPKYFTFAFLLFSILFSVSCSNDTLLEEEEICCESEATLRSAFCLWVPRSSASRGTFTWCPPYSPIIRHSHPRIVLQPPLAHNTLRLRVESLGGVEKSCPTFCWNSWSFVLPIEMQGFFRHNGPPVMIRYNMHWPHGGHGNNWASGILITCYTRFIRNERLINIARSNPGQQHCISNEVYVAVHWVPWGSVITWETFTRTPDPNDPGAGPPGHTLVEFRCFDPFCPSGCGDSCGLHCGRGFSDWIPNENVQMVQSHSYRRMCTMGGCPSRHTWMATVRFVRIVPNQ